MLLYANAAPSSPLHPSTASPLTTPARTTQSMFTKPQNITIFLIVSLFLFIALLSESLLARSKEQAKRAGFGCDYYLAAPHTVNRTVGTTMCVQHDAAPVNARLEAHFATPAAAGARANSLRFLAVGDFGRDGYCCQRDVALEMARAANAMGGLDFVANVGDSFYEFGLLSPTEEQTRTSFQDVYLKYDSLRVPWYSVLGNHEYRGSAEAVLQFAQEHDEFFEMPARFYDTVLTSKNGGLSVHVLFLDTNPMIKSYYRAGYDDARDTMLRQPDGIKTQDGDKQLKWFEARLKQSTADVRIVVSHHPPFTSGSHYREDELFLRRNISPLLEKYRVPLMLSGHDHNMQHYVKDSVHYFVSAGGSKVEADFSNGDDFLKYFGRINGFLAVDVTRERIAVSILDIKGDVIRTTLIKV